MVYEEITESTSNYTNKNNTKKLLDDALNIARDALVSNNIFLHKSVEIIIGLLINLHV